MIHYNRRKEYGHKYNELTDKEKDEFIDDEIKDLVRAINSFDGINTIFSCSGHGKSEGYVSFVAKRDRSLKKILNKLSCGFKWGDGSYFYVGCSYVSCVRDEVTYSIRFFSPDPNNHQGIIDWIVKCLESKIPYYSKQ